MVIIQVYSKSLKNYYKNHLCSQAVIFVIITTIISICFPFVFAYRSRGFWLKHDTFYEQPNIRFKGEYLFIGYTDNLSNPIVCTNFPRLQFLTEFDTCPTIKVKQVDHNFDGKIDTLQFILKANIPNNTKFLAIDLLVTLDYRIHTTCKLNMQTAIILQETISHLVNVLEITSNLQISQNYPLFCYSKYKDTRYNQSVIQNSEELSNYKFDNIINGYSKRNITTYLSNTYRKFKFGSQSNFALHLKIHYPEHQFYFKPGFWQVMKWAWIQYFSVYIIFAWFIKKIKKYVFDKHLVLFHEVSPLKKER